MPKRRKRNAPPPSKGPHDVTVNLSRDELLVLQRVAHMAGVNIATLLRVILALRVSQALPVLGVHE